MRFVSIAGRGVVHAAHDPQPVHYGRIRTLCTAICKNVPGKRYRVTYEMPTGKRLCADCERILGGEAE